MTKIDLTDLIKKRESEVLNMETKAGKLGILVCTPDENTHRYIKAKTKDFPKMGHEVIVAYVEDSFKENEEKLRELIETCDSVLVQEPNRFSKELNDIIKDKCSTLFGLDVENFGKYDPTTTSVKQIIEHCNGTPNDAISVLGCGMFGKAISSMLINERYTVLSLNSRTPNQELYRRQSLFSVLVFSQGTLTPLNHECIIDVSFNISHDTDLDYMYTPMVGGVGRLTTLNLLESFNNIMAWR